MSISHGCLLLIFAEKAAAFTGRAARAITRFNVHDDVYIMGKMNFEGTYYFVPDYMGFTYR
jgi:hypothetical protein